MVPPAEITESVFEMDSAAREAAGIDALPGSLEEAIHAMEDDQLILDTLGKQRGRELHRRQDEGVG